MTKEELILLYPRLYHMAHDGAWPSIKAQGLLSAEAIVDAYGVVGERRTQILSTRRPESVILKASGRPDAVVRDQKPMSDLALKKCLPPGLEPAEWYALLNGYSFFWLSKDRVWSLLKARAYRDKPQTVLTINTAGLVAIHCDHIRLSPINSGSTLYDPVKRDAQTFMTVSDFPFAARAKTRRPPANVVELVVEHSVPDVADHVLAVHRVRNDQIEEEIWRSPNATADDRP